MGVSYFAELRIYKPGPMGILTNKVHIFSIFQGKGFDHGWDGMGRDGAKPAGTVSPGPTLAGFVQRAVRAAAQAAGISKPATCHSLRH